MVVAVAGHERDDCVISQTCAWPEAEAAAMDHPSNGLDMVGRSAMAGGGQGRGRREATV